MEAWLDEVAGCVSENARASAIYRGVLVDLGREQLNCPRHGAYLATVRQLPGRKVLRTPCDGCRLDLEAVRDAEHAELRRQEREQILVDRITQAGVPARFFGKRLADYKAENDGQRKVLALAQDYVTRFKYHRERGASLVLAGQPGTGKSLLAHMVLQELAAKGYGIKYVTAQAMTLAVRNTWGSDGEGREKAVLDELCEVTLLVIDEIGVQAGTESEKALLFQVVDRRYSDMLPTIFATNLAKEGFKEFVGDRVWDRLVENARWVPFTWESYRPTARREMAE